MEEELEEQERDIWNVLAPLHPLNNIKITNYFNYEARVNDVFSRNNLPKIKDRVYVINVDDKNIKEKHWGFNVITEIQLYILIILELINQLLTIYLEHKIINLLCLGFIVFVSSKWLLKERQNNI